MANSFRNDIFLDPLLLSWAVIGLLALNVVLSVVFAIFGVVIIAMPDWVAYAQDGGLITLLAVSVGMLGMLESPLRIVTGIVFLVWVYRTYNNLSALKSRNLEFSPGWAVGWWFIPFANLVKPFQIVREIFNESDPEFDAETGFLHISPGTPVEVGFWWAAFLASNVFYRVSDAFYGKGDEPASEYYAPFFLGGALLSVAAASLAIYIVKETARRQRVRYENVSRSFGSMDQPPPPPTFDQRI